MKSFTIAVSATISLAATLVSGAAIEVEGRAGNLTSLAAPFGINIGNNAGTGNTVAWVAGQSKCNNVVLGPIGVNFCGRDFKPTNPFTGNVITFVAEGCGESPFWITQVSQGGIYAFCTSFGEADACNVGTLFHCV